MRAARFPARRRVVTLLLATLASAGLPSHADDSREEAAEPAPPNLVLVVIDTLRADHLSAYGYGRETSPYLEELAAEGTLYEKAIAAAPWTLPSHASLFTGLHPRDHGTTSQQWELEPRFDTLAERLSRAGTTPGASRTTSGSTTPPA